MESFLTFLSNNYLYFLIAAGVLFFALIGFLVDLKKKNNIEEVPSVTSTPDLETIQESNSSEVANEEVPNINMDTITSSEESFIPEPPMPQEPVDEVFNDSTLNGSINTFETEPSVAQEQPAQDVSQPVETMNTPMQEEPVNVLPEQDFNQPQENIEEFK